MRQMCIKDPEPVFRTILPEVRDFAIIETSRRGRVERWGGRLRGGQGRSHS